MIIIAVSQSLRIKKLLLNLYSHVHMHLCIIKAELEFYLIINEDPFFLIKIKLWSGF